MHQCYIDSTLPGFHTLMRKDRPNGPSGGVGLYISQQFLVTRRHDLESPVIELLCMGRNKIT